MSQQQPDPITGTDQVSPEQWPRWAYDLDRLLPVKPQFVLSGHIRDRFSIPLGDNHTQFIVCSFYEALQRLLQEKGYRYLVIYDRTDGFTVYPDTPDIRADAANLYNLEFAANHDHGSFLANFPKVLQQIVTSENPVAVVIDYASRLSSDPSRLSEEELEFYSACEKLAYLAKPRRMSGQDCAFFNPLIWLLNRESDLPAWYTLDNENIHSQVIAAADYETRMRAAGSLSSFFLGADAKDEEHAAFSEKFALLTEGMSLQSMVSITQLARRLPAGNRNVADAVRNYQVGITDNPWKKAHLRERICNAPGLIIKRVKGQEQAVQKTTDILTRSVMGLSGAQSGGQQSRPKGVLFFAGPTGVGKTELAKAISELLFGDEKAYIRFDMSEFAAEHSDARLLGAPPGYVGYEAGGELTSAVREKPFSVILFDEIEKSHPRILDKFLQILEDGRLTDGRGQTVYFSESVIVFTSNLGIYGMGEGGRRKLLINQDDDFDTLQRTIHEGIANHFKVNLGRPELLNRLGENIVVFDFIHPDVAIQIFNKMLENICRRVKEENNCDLVLSAEAESRLREICTKELSNGGRGIGNALETVFINPLSRALFSLPVDSDGRLESKLITIKKVREEVKGIFSLELSCS